MKKIITKFRRGIPVYLLVFAAVLITANAFSQTTYTSVANGDWTADATWSGTGTPVDGDIVIIEHHVTYNSVGEVSWVSGGLRLDGTNASLVGLNFNIGIAGSKNFEVINGSALHINNLLIDGTGSSSVLIIDALSRVVLEGNFTMGPGGWSDWSTKPDFVLDGVMVVSGAAVNGICLGLDRRWDNHIVGSGSIKANGYGGCGYIFGVLASELGDNLDISGFVWTGEGGDSSWDTPTNWRYLGIPSAIIPGPNTDITINATFYHEDDGNSNTVTVTNWPVYDNTVPRPTGDCRSLTIAPGCQMTIIGDMFIMGDLTIKADATDGMASLLAEGYANVSGTTKAQIYVPSRGNGWAMISPPLVTPKNAFFTDNGFTNNIGLLSETTSIWSWYDGTGGDFDLKPGVALMIKANGLLEFTGTLPVLSGPTSDVETPVSFNGYGFNGLGNPFTASMDMDAYLTANSSWQSGTPTAWFYNGATYEAFDILNDGAYSQAGQGFMVQAASSASAVSIDKSTMQFHNVLTSIKSGKIGNYKFKLHASLNGASRTSKINFRYDMTTGLDQKYDAMKYDQEGFDLYTKVDGYPELNFEIQALPEYNLGSVVLPVGLDCMNGGDVTFSTSEINLPDGVVTMFLEDKVTGRFIDLTAEPYTAQVEAGTKGEGRFYIHFKSLTTGIEIDEVQPLKAFYNGNQEIQIEGQVGAKSTANVYDMSGKLLGNYQLQGQNNNVIQVNNLKKGVYILQVIDGEKVYKTRIPVL